MKVQLHQLQLVYPPVTNQEAEWLRTSDESLLWDALARSNLYMVGTRAEATFEDVAYDPELHRLTARYFVPGIGESPFDVDIGAVLARGGGLGEFEFEAGKKGIRAWRCDANGEKVDVVDWFTTEKLLWNKWRGATRIGGLEKCREFANYELLYVGISQEDDSFARLVKKAHEKRGRILSNEHPRRPGSRVTDELVFFFFAVDPLRVHVLEDVHDVDELSEVLSPSFDKRRIVADAEKALISALEPAYNLQLYAKYPVGADGLHGTGLERYGYVIDEDVTFHTKSAILRGGYRSVENLGPVVRDMILVDGAVAKFVRHEDLRTYPNPASDP